MKAKELMIGDWVKIVRGYIGQLKETYELVLASNYEPIPLTEEILKANGFFVRDNNTFIKTFGEYFVFVELDYNDIEISKYYGIGTDDEECEYGSDIHFEENIKVHELQHALRLCGLDELADNFKVDYGNKY